MHSRRQKLDKQVTFFLFMIVETYLAYHIYLLSETVGMSIDTIMLQHPHLLSVILFFSSMSTSVSLHLF